MRTRLATLACLLAISCTPTLADLAPFPCKDDGCPDGLGCLGAQCVPLGGCERGAQCARPELPKCVPLPDGREDAGAFTLSCVPVVIDGGTPGALGAACTSAGLGADSCDKGLVCDTLYGAPSCRTACSESQPCGSGESCMPLAPDSAIGACAPACTAGACGGACRTFPGLDGKPHELCVANAGTKRFDDRCTSSTECGSGLVCWGGRCMTTCSADSACGAGFKCDAKQGGLGRCRCRYYSTVCGTDRSCGWGEAGQEHCFANTVDPVPLFARCGSGFGGCPPNSVCYGISPVFYCQPFCDDQHGCNGMRCDKKATFLSEGGVCSN